MASCAKGSDPTGQQTAAHLDSLCAALPATVEKCYARAASGFYCWEAVETDTRHGCRLVRSAQTASRLIEEWQAAGWTGSPRTDADGQCQFRYQPQGEGKAHRFVALRYPRRPGPTKSRNKPSHTSCLTPPEYTSRVFVTGWDAPIDVAVGFYRQRAGAENLTQEANHHAGLAAHPSARWAVNCVHFPLAMLAYNLNSWLMPGSNIERPAQPIWRRRIVVAGRVLFAVFSFVSVGFPDVENITA